MASDIPITAIRFDDEHRALLAACAEEERTTKTDILKRALRAYAKKIGVSVDIKPKRAKKPSTK